MFLKNPPEKLFFASMTRFGQSGLGPSGATEAVAARYREILPPEFEVETDGPILKWQVPDAGSSGLFFGNVVLHIPLMSAKDRLEQFAKMYFESLPAAVARVANVKPSMAWPATGMPCHVRVTNSEIRIWYGPTDNEDDAVLTVRPIPRTELGV